MLLVGVILFFGILTYLIIKRETHLISDIYTNHSYNTALLISGQFKELMQDSKSENISKHLDRVNTNPVIKIGILGPDGTPVFGSKITAPDEVFTAQKEATVKTGNDLIFYEPLLNEKMCHDCHNPLDKTRGMIVIKTSLRKVTGEIKETARRIVLFALFLGVTSEIFLLIVLRAFIIKPINELKEGAEDIKNGILGRRVHIRSKDEIGVLGNAFNEMAEQVEHSRAHLETAVGQRTKELMVIAELSSNVFKGTLTLREIIRQFLEAITDRIGYKYTALCLVDRQTGLLLQEYKKGIDSSLCGIEIPLSSDHPFAEIVREARPAIKNSSEIGLPGTFGSMAVLPVLSHQRRRCKEINLCTFENCPAFSGTEERCWLVSGTLCRSPRALLGKEKIYGCLFCDAFPVIGVLIAGKEELTEDMLAPLEILASEIASAVENQRFIDGKKEDIVNLIKLHDISVGKIQYLEMPRLLSSIAVSATTFANMDAAILWTCEIDGSLRFRNASGLKASSIPVTLPMKGSFPGRAIIEDRPIETIEMQDIKCMRGLIDSEGFLYAASIPLKFENLSYGCLTLLKRKDFFMNDSEKAIIQLFATQAAAAMNTAQIYDALKIEKEFSDAIFNNMSMGVMVVDAGGRVVRLNQAGFEIMKINDYAIGVGLEAILPDASAALLALDAFSSKEVEIQRGSATVPVGFTNSPILDAGGNQTGTVIVFRDLTEIRKLQAEIKKRQHFEAMGKVIAGVAHEIRNPLFGISSLVQILERDIKSPEHQALLRAVLKEAQRMKNLVEELLLYSRPSKLNIVEIDIGVFAEKLRPYIKAKKEDISLDINIPASSAVKADADKLTQVLLNLIDNSLNAGCRNIGISAEGKDDKVVLTVKDDGYGIKKEDMEKVFDPFYTTRKEGTGLGLSICRKLIEDHSGGIEIESAQGIGTTVKLILPA